MLAAKPLDQSANKWKNRASVAGPDYLNGINNPRTSWAKAASGAQANYVAGVTAAANAGRYGKGINKAGDAKWQANAAAKGPTRYAEGVGLAVATWSNAFQPYFNVITNLTLPNRGPTGSAQNLQRVSAVVTALRNAKLGTTA